MTNFEVHINGNKVSLAGLNSKYGVLTAIVTCRRRFGEEEGTVTIDISGLDSETRNRLEWFQQDLHHNDEITVKILPSGESETPSVLTEEDMRKRLLEANLKTFYRLRDELKDHINS